jgi:hypothetical protein
LADRLQSLFNRVLRFVSDQNDRLESAGKADPAKWRVLQVSTLSISTLTTKVITMLIEGGIFIDNFVLHGVANSIAELLHTAGDPDYTGESECEPAPLFSHECMCACILLLV